MDASRRGERDEAVRAQLQKDIDAARAEGMDVTHWRLKQSFQKRGIPWTRDSYIDYAWQGLDLPEEWDEGELPDDLQDWSAPPPTR